MIFTLAVWTHPDLANLFASVYPLRETGTRRRRRSARSGLGRVIGSAMVSGMIIAPILRKTRHAHRPAEV